jgi:hypothetical protein
LRGNFCANWLIDDFGRSRKSLPPLPNDSWIVINSTVTTLAFSPAFVPSVDSGRPGSISGARAAKAFLAALCALVPFVVRGLLGLADRVRTRFTLRQRAGGIDVDSSVTLLEQPGVARTITRRKWAPYDMSAPLGIEPRLFVRANTLQPRAAYTVESAADTARTDSHEARNPDQREPERDAGRNHRGRRPR